MMRDVRRLFKQEEEKHYKPKTVSNFCNHNYLEYESKGDKNRVLLIYEYLNKIKPYMKNMIIDLQNSDTWQIQFTIAINFISSKDPEEECVMHTWCDNIEFTSYNDANEVADELFDSLRSRYQGNLETSMTESDFILIQFN